MTLRDVPDHKKWQQTNSLDDSSDSNSAHSARRGALHRRSGFKRSGIVSTENSSEHAAAAFASPLSSELAPECDHKVDDEPRYKDGKRLGDLAVSDKDGAHPQKRRKVSAIDTVATLANQYWTIE
jgi:hypothetical protein